MGAQIIPFPTKNRRRFILISKPHDHWLVEIVPAIDHPETERLCARSGEAVQFALAMALQFGFPIRSDAVSSFDWDQLVIEARGAR